MEEGTCRKCGKPSIERPRWYRGSDKLDHCEGCATELVDRNRDEEQRKEASAGFPLGMPTWWFQRLDPKLTDTRALIILKGVNKAVNRFRGLKYQKSDIIDDAFARVWEATKDQEDLKGLMGYAETVTRNLCTDLLAESKRFVSVEKLIDGIIRSNEQKGKDDLSPADAEAQLYHQIGDLADHQRGKAWSTRDDQFSIDLMLEFMKDLDDETKRIIRLRLWKNLTVEDIAKKTMLQPRTVYRRLEDGLATLTTKVKAAWGK